MLEKLLSLFKKKVYQLEVKTDKGNIKNFSFDRVAELCNCLCDICSHVDHASLIYNPAEHCYKVFIAWNGKPYDKNYGRYFWDDKSFIQIKGYKSFIDYCLNLYGNEPDSEKTTAPAIKINGVGNNLYNTTEVNYWLGDKKQTVSRRSGK